MSELNFEKPAIIEELSVSEIMAQMKNKLAEIAPEFEAYLESDPLIKLIEICAYRELLLRQRINNAANANLLAFATGSDLDQLGAFYNVDRFENESDSVYRMRINAKIAGWSCAGSKEAYRYYALSADSRVKDAIAYSPDAGLVRIAILSNEAGGEVSDELLLAVKEYANRDDIKVLTDTVEIVPCDIVDVNVRAKLTLMNGTPSEVLNTISAQFTEEFNKFVGLGISVSKAWIVSHLFGSAVQDVELLSPVEDVQISNIQCARLGSINLSV